MLALLLAFAGAHAQPLQVPLPAATSPMILGVLLPPETPEREAVLQGVRVAAEEASQAGLLPVVLAVRGRTGPWGSDADEAARLVAVDGAQALLGPVDGAAAHLVLQVARRTRRPAAVLCPDASVTATGLDRVTRVGPRTADEVRLLLNAVAGGSRVRFGLVTGEGRSGLAIQRDLAAAGLPASLTLPVKEVPLEPEELGHLLAAHPVAAVLLLPSHPATAGELARRFRQAGFTGVLGVPGRLLGTAFFDAAGAAGEGIVVSLPTPWPPEGGDAEVSPAACVIAGWAREAARLLIDDFRGRAGIGAASVEEAGCPRSDQFGNWHAPLGLFVLRGGRPVSLGCPDLPVGTAVLRQAGSCEDKRHAH